ncbi:DUF4129 domain-containing protein [Spirosoma radiotolerans]|uniref:Protein-glutamine gamma-glutamyltransferase-like C-terminal domain-containing protein n=1 Tax=Spirosoma radiotolerans TaxID=1379870 RepID=A0A0E3ZT34_9BACT|nr:DUF4129 domain-containing protein [Spirosoma radiotolerans]AKD53590.1 hypothetical protein SD10_00415 [Spirosoma radiotolerans]
MKESINSWFALYGLRITSLGRYYLTAGCLCLLLLASPVALAQSNDTTKAVNTRDDRTPLQVRYPEKDHLRDLQTDHDYQYGYDAPPPENPLARLWAWFLRKLGAFLSSEAYENVWQYVILVIIAGSAIYLLLKAEVLTFLLPKKAQSAGLAYENTAEDIHEIDFDTAIDEAVSHRNFRLAVRLLYLKTIKQLTDAGRIAYKPEKTNRQYVYELANSPLQADFERLTAQFEFVWYGDFPIDERQFASLRTAFVAFNKSGQHQPIN